MAAAIRTCLDAADTDAAILNFLDQPLDVGPLESWEKPHPVIGLAAMLGAGALLRRGLPDRVVPLLSRFSDALAPAGQQGEKPWRMINPFHGLYAPLVDAALAMKDQRQAVQRLNDCWKHMRSRGEDKLIAEPLTSALIAHPKASDYGPFRIAPAWLLDRYEQVLAMAPLDHRLAEVQTCHAGLAESALLAEKPQRAMPLIAQELDWYLTCSVIDTSHFEFNAICILAELGRFEEALRAARRLVRRGYHLAWRFELDTAQRMVWTQEMRQNEWLSNLAATADYQRFLKEDLPGPLLGDDPAVNPLCLVRDGAWSGKKPRRCRISRQMIAPGDPVVRYRRLFDRSSDGDLEMASQDAFATSSWQTARRQFETETIPVTLLFPRSTTHNAELHDAPYIHAFVHDVARDPKAFDIARAATLIADHEPPPIAYTWEKGDWEKGDREKGDGNDRWAPAFPPFAGADGHGDAVNLAWRIVKAGFRDAMLAQVSVLPDAKADKVFAMLATFEDAALRQAAATHFDSPDLPNIMQTIFKDRLTLEDHETLADYGGNARYRAGIVAAMRAYGLHLYSNYRPKADWFLAGLERYTHAGGSALLYVLIDHPEDDPVLATVIEKGWLPDRAGGSVDEYGNAQPFYVRATLFHLARHQPERLEPWLTPQQVSRWSGMAYSRETLRLIKAYRSRLSGSDSRKRSQRISGKG